MSDVGRLWIELLRFYCLELNTTDAVVCIRELNIVKRAEKKWTSKKLAIEGIEDHVYSETELSMDRGCL